MTTGSGSGVQPGRAALALAALGLAVVVAVLYAPSIHYGLIWDDPLWFRRGTGLSVSQLFAGTSRYQFYRPLTLLYYQLWWIPGGVLHLREVHAAQVIYHLLATLLCMDLALRWSRDRLTTALAGLVFAVLPFSQQAVAWAATQQPLETVLLLASVSAYLRFRRPGRRVWLLLSLTAYAAALFVQETAGPLCLFFFLLELERRPGAGTDTAARVHPRLRPDRRFVWPSLYVALATVYGLLWLAAPRLSGIAGLAFERRVLAFLLQAVAFPVARALALPPVEWSAMALLLTLGAVWAAAVVLLARAGQGRLALLASAWIGLTLLPIWAALGYKYVEVGPRLVYPAAPGIAILWAAVATLGLRAPHRAVRVATAALVVVVTAVSTLDVLAQNRLFAVGAAHMRELTAVDDQPGERLVFINFPDRYRLRRPIFPLGYWGITLAPVAMELSDFAAATAGRAATTESWLVPSVGAADRAAWPYAVDMRGVIVDAARLLEIARGTDALYLSDYRPNGSLRLHPVGGVAREVAGDPVAEFPGVTRLARATLAEDGPGVTRLRLVWQPQGTFQPEDTVFVHVFGPDGVQVLGADGDAWGGLLPLPAWPKGQSIEDVRSLETSHLPPGSYRVTVGLYNRRTGERYPAVGQAGQSYADDEVPVGTVEVR